MALRGGAVRLVALRSRKPRRAAAVAAAGPLPEALPGALPYFTETIAPDGSNGRRADSDRRARSEGNDAKDRASFTWTNL